MTSALHQLNKGTAMMWCECRDCMGDEDSIKPCINASMEAEHRLMKSQMNQSFIKFFLVMLVIVCLLGIFV